MARRSPGQVVLRERFHEADGAAEIPVRLPQAAGLQAHAAQGDVGIGELGRGAHGLLVMRFGRVRTPGRLEPAARHVVHPGMGRVLGQAGLPIALRLDAAGGIRSHADEGGKAMAQAEIRDGFCGGRPVRPRRTRRLPISDSFTALAKRSRSAAGSLASSATPLNSRPLEMRRPASGPKGDSPMRRLPRSSTRARKKPAARPSTAGDRHQREHGRPCRLLRRYPVCACPDWDHAVLAWIQV